MRRRNNAAHLAKVSRRRVEDIPIVRDDMRFEIVPLECQQSSRPRRETRRIVTTKSLPALLANAAATTASRLERLRHVPDP